MAAARCAERERSRPYPDQGRCRRSYSDTDKLLWSESADRWFSERHMAVRRASELRRGLRVARSPRRLGFAAAGNDEFLECLRAPVLDIKPSYNAVALPERLNFVI